MLTIKENPTLAFVPASGRGIVFEATAGETLLGSCRFVLDGTSVAVEGGACDDRAVLDGLVRAGLFFAMERGAETFACTAAEPAFCAALSALGIPARGRLEPFFSGGCKGGCAGDCAACRG